MATRTKEAARIYRAKNRERILETARLRYAKNPDKYKLDVVEYRIANPTKNYAAVKKWRTKNPAKVLFYVTCREERIKQAMPKWADKEAMQDIYQEGIYHQMHVDHIIPLKGKNVYGLHWEGNLQLLTKEANASKGNRYAQ